MPKRLTKPIKVKFKAILKAAKKGRFKYGKRNSDVGKCERIKNANKKYYVNGKTY